MDRLAYCVTPEAAFWSFCVSYSLHRWPNAIGQRESFLSFYWPSLKVYFTRIERRAQVRPTGGLDRTSGQPQVQLSLLRSNSSRIHDMFQEEGGDLSFLAPADLIQLTAPSLHFLLAAILQNITALRYATHGQSAN